MRRPPLLMACLGMALGLFSQVTPASADCTVEGRSWAPTSAPITRTIQATPGSVCSHGAYVSAAATEKSGISVVSVSSRHALSTGNTGTNACGDLRINDNDSSGWTFVVRGPVGCTDFFEIQVRTRDRAAHVTNTLFHYRLTVKAP